MAVFTGADVADLGDLPVNDFGLMHAVPGFPILAQGSVDALGQPVAAVVATSVAAASDALEQIGLEFEERRPVLDGGAGEEDLFEEVPGNAVYAAAWEHKPVYRQLGTLPVRVEAEIRHARVAPAPLEPRAAVAVPEGNRLTVWLPSQSPQRARYDLADILGVGAAELRVIAPDVGGAFGMKASLYPEDVLVAFAARQLERAVRWTASRSEEFLSATQGRGIKLKGRLNLQKSGQLQRLTAEIRAPLGHWLPYSAVVPMRNAYRILPGPYRVAAEEIDVAAHVSNTAPVGIYRGAGRPEAAVLMERLIDKAAAGIGMDPAVLREKNFERTLKTDRHTGPERLDNGQYRALLSLACEAADYAGLRRRQADRRSAGEIVGVGLGFYIEPSGQGWETARVALDADNNVTAWLGSCAQGQGRATAATQIVVDELGVDPAGVSVCFGDTESVPRAIGALASRSTPIGGSALVAAARKVKARLDAGENGPIEEAVLWEAHEEAWGYGCAIAEVAIDPETGVLTVERMTWVDDCGTVINPMLVEGQLMGGIAQGLGEALMERIVYDEDGQLLTGSLMDYALPRAADMPPIAFDRLETPTDRNLLGARGVGEAGTIGAPAAILNAALDALAPFGVTDLDMPLTAETIWRAINGMPQND